MSYSTDRALAALASLVVVTGCATAGPDYAPPAAPAAHALTAPGETVPASVVLGAPTQADWWSQFGSADIDAVVRQAAAGGQNLAAARARLIGARETLLSQPGQLQGSASSGIERRHVNLAANGFTGFPGVTLTNPTVSLYSVGGTARYDFDIGGGARRERETRQARVQAAAEEANAAGLTLTGQVVSQALTIASLKAQIAAAEELTNQDRSLVDVANKALQGGSGTRLDVATAEAEAAADQAMLPGLRQQLAVARHALAVLVGQAPSEWTPPDFDLEHIALPASLPAALPSELARARPDIRLAEARLHAATAQIGVADARLYPSLTLSAAFIQTSLAPEDIFASRYSGWAVGPLGVSLPIFDRGALKAQSRAARAAAEAAGADYRQTVLLAFGQVADVLQAIQNDAAATDTQAEAVRVASDSLRLNRLRYQGGKSTLLPVIDAQRTYQRARLAYIRARSQQYLDVVQLAMATGGGWTGEQPSASPHR